MLTAELISRQKSFPWRTKHSETLVLAEAQNGHAINADHERCQGGLDAGHVRGGVYDACLQGGSVSDFEQRIDVVNIDLPKPEDLYLCRVQGTDIDGRLTRAKQEMVVISIQLIPGILDHILTHIIGRRIAAFIIGLLRLLPDCQCGLDTQANVPVPYGSWRARSSCKKAISHLERQLS